MTGAYVRIERDGKWENIEVEHLTDAELYGFMERQQPKRVFQWLQMTCQALRECELIIIECNVAT